MRMHAVGRWLVVLGAMHCSSATANPDPSATVPPSAGDASPQGADAGASADSGATSGSACATSYAAAVTIPVKEPALVEASGVAASKVNDGVLWLHNDSGDSARVFAVATDGTALGQLTLPGVVAHDFEDIETAQCPDGSGACIWIADLGNNALTRQDLAIHAIPEPSVSKSKPLGTSQASRVWTFPVTYPKGVVLDVESLIVTPNASAIWIFEKVDGDRARIFSYAGPFVDRQTLSFAQVGTLTSPGIAIAKGKMITGADIHPSGERVLIRVYTGVYEYRLTGGQTIADLDAAQRVAVDPLPLAEKQGEAVAYDEQGTGVWTISEDPNGKATQPLHHYACP